MLWLLACHSPETADSPAATVTGHDSVTDSGGSSWTTDTGGLPDGLHGTAPSTAVPLPSFQATNDDGATRYPTNLVGSPSVLFFLPSLEDGSSITEARTYDQRVEAFGILKVRIVAVTFETPEQAADLVSRRSLDYEVWTDDDKTLALTYGAISSTDAAAPARKTVLLDDQGGLVLSYDPVNVVTGADDVYADCKAIFDR
jgi:peroxiredoxin Q/BCP